MKRELVVNGPEQINCARIGHMRATYFDASMFAGKFRMCFGQFAIDQERNVSIKTLLQFVQLRILAIPHVRLVHYEHDCVRLQIVRDHVYYRNAISGFR